MRPLVIGAAAALRALLACYGHRRRTVGQPTGAPCNDTRTERAMPIGRRDLMLAAGVGARGRWRAGAGADGRCAGRVRAPTSVSMTASPFPFLPGMPRSARARTSRWCWAGAGNTSPRGCWASAKGLHDHGVPYEMPDVIVGTSAGSFVGEHHRRRAPRVADARVRFLRGGAQAAGRPRADARAQPQPAARARAVTTASNASLETIQAIGRGAMAARNQSVESLQKMYISLITRNRSWPSDKFHAVSMEC